MIPTTAFYKNYQVDFFRLQQMINMEALQKSERWLQMLNEEGSLTNDAEIKHIIRSHIRLTFLHSIDTLFELIFGLYPRKNEIQDQNLQLILAKDNEKINKPRILGLASQDESTLKELECEINYGNNKVSLLRYIFYYQINKDNSVDVSGLEHIEKSLPHIKKILVILAQELADKSEYNSLKHALRIYPTSGYLKLFTKDTNQEIAGIDFDNAHQYIFESKDKINLVTKNLDSERDYKLSMVVSRMIWNIIKIRATMMAEGKGIGKCFIYFFDESDYKDSENLIKHRQKIKLSIKK